MSGGHEASEDASPPRAPSANLVALEAVTSTGHYADDVMGMSRMAEGSVDGVGSLGQDSDPQEVPSPGKRSIPPLQISERDPESPASRASPKSPHRLLFGRSFMKRQQPSASGGGDNDDEDAVLFSPRAVSPKEHKKNVKRMFAAWSPDMSGLRDGAESPVETSPMAKSCQTQKGRRLTITTGDQKPDERRMDAYRADQDTPNLFDLDVLTDLGSFFGKDNGVGLALLAVAVAVCSAALALVAMRVGAVARGSMREDLKAHFAAHAAAMNGTRAFTLEEVHGAIDAFDPRSGDMAAQAGLVATTLALMVLGMVSFFRAGAKTRAGVELAQQDRSLLVELLPPAIIGAIHSGDRSLAMWHPELTFVFTDVAGFTKLTAEAAPDTLVSVLNAVFQIFDATAVEFGIFKVKTMGDAFMGVAGLAASDLHHIVATVEWGFKVIRLITEGKLSFSDEKGETTLLNIRVGLSVGPCISGVLGAIKPAYDFWGKTVNMASRMESAGKPGRINCSPVAHALLREVSDYEFEAQKGVFIKGEGKMDTYLVKDTEARRRHSEKLLHRLSGPGHAKPDNNHALQQLAAIQSAENFQTDIRHVLHAMALLSEELELDKAMNTVVSAVKDLLSCDRATLFLVDEQRQELWSYNRVEHQDGETRVRAKIRIPIATGVAGAAATSGQIVNIKDAYSDERFNKKVDIQTGYRTQTLLALPVKRGDQVVAVVQAVNKAQGAFSLQDEFLISLLGRQLAIQLKHTTLFEAVKLSKERQLLLGKISHEINTQTLQTGSALTMFDAVTRGAKRLIECDAAALFVVVPNAGCMYAVESSQEGSAKTVLARIGEGAVGKVAETGKVMNVTDVTQSSTYDERVDGFGGQCYSVLAVPILLADEVAGVLVVKNTFLPTEPDARGAAAPQRDSAFNDDDLAILESYATFIGLSLQGLHLMEAQLRQDLMLSFLFAVSVSNSSSLETEIGVMQRELPMLFSCKACRVFILQQDDTVTHLDGHGALVSLPVAPDGCGVIGLVASGALPSYRTATTTPFHDDRAYLGRYDNTFGGDAPDTALVVPLVVENRVTGVLQLVHKHPSGERLSGMSARACSGGMETFDAHDEAFATKVSSVVALHLEHTSMRTSQRL
eukprot:TRINITY_DN1046_c0_g5_i3.p1 TRINITY_DN1046_c0_g5~~TRINITY_DN1046_c0_g5_i3.p1  ORF type:complete len:1125 (+),score=377.25 TRINITY_DN1046_c0_g5_i3:61-3435(+)